MKLHIYADNAATSRISDRAFEAMLPWLNEEYGNASQSYAFSRKPKQAIAEARDLIAESIGASSDEIYFTSGGTESNNWVIKNACLNCPERTGIITSSIEHHAILNACDFERVYRKRKITIVPVLADATVCIEDFAQTISSSDGLASIMLANNEVGTIEPIQELAKIAHSKGLLFHTDAVQAIGHIAIDVKSLDVDFLSSSAHKFNGPKGIGFLYVKKGITLPPFICGGAQEMRMRAGTENIASIVGMAVALSENLKNLSSVQGYLCSLEKSLLAKLDDAKVQYKRNGATAHIPGNISLSFKGFDGEAIMHRLDLVGISVSTGSACDSQNVHISHVLKAMKLDEDWAKGTIRISLGRDNTEEDINTIVDALVRIVR